MLFRGGVMACLTVAVSSIASADELLYRVCPDTPTLCTFMQEDGTVLFDPIDGLSPLINRIHAGQFPIPVGESGRVRYIDASGETVIDGPFWAGGNFPRGGPKLAPVVDHFERRQAGDIYTVKFINETGEETGIEFEWTPPSIYDINVFMFDGSGITSIFDVTTGKYALVDASGTPVSDVRLDWPVRFQQEGWGIASVDGGLGIIDRDAMFHAKPEHEQARTAGGNPIRLALGNDSGGGAMSWTLYGEDLTAVAGRTIENADFLLNDAGSAVMAVTGESLRLYDAGFEPVAEFSEGASTTGAYGPYFSLVTGDTISLVDASGNVSPFDDAVDIGGYFEAADCIVLKVTGPHSSPDPAWGCARFDGSYVVEPVWPSLVVNGKLIGVGHGVGGNSDVKHYLDSEGRKIELR